MLKYLAEIFDQDGRQVLLAAAGGLTVTLSNIESVIRICIGLATFAYICLKIAKVRKGKDQ